MATITKRATGFQVQVRRKGFPQVSKMFKSRREAEAWARLVESEQDRGIFLDRSEAERCTLADLIRRYIAEVTPEKKSSESERIRLERFLREESICAYKASALTGRAIAAWRDQRLLTVSSSTVARELAILSHVINTAIREWGIHITNPVGLVRRPKPAKGRERRLSETEEEVLLRELTRTTRNRWIRPLVILAIETGMRRSELLRLKWNDISISRGVVSLSDTKNGDSRSVPLSVRARETLQGLPVSIDGRVFPTTQEAVRLAFERAVKRAKLEDFHFHDLRHEAVSRLFEKGLNIMEVASISGHRSLQMLKRYTHVDAEKLARRLG